MAYDARWDTSGIDFNGAGILAQGSDDYVIYWGDGTQEFVSANRDDDGDGVNEVAVYFHSYTQDGVYDITIVDDPNDPSTPNVRMRAYMHNNDPDGTAVNGSNLKDMVLTGVGADSIKTKGGDDWIDANAGNDSVDGGEGNDLLIGGEGADILRGGLGDDQLVGGFDEATPGATDTFYGEDGNDFFFSGKGKALLVGGAGADGFAFASIGESNAIDGVDKIRDFEQGLDKIYLILSSLSSTGSLTFIADEKFHGVGGEVRAVAKGGDTRISIDLDGDRVADMQIDLTGAYTLTASDIYLF